MPNNRAAKEIDQKSFLSFAFQGQEPPVVGTKLTAAQEKVLDLTRQGMKPGLIAEELGHTPSSIYDNLVKIREKGWLI